MSQRFNNLIDAANNAPKINTKVTGKRSSVGLSKPNVVENLFTISIDQIDRGSVNKVKNGAKAAKENISAKPLKRLMNPFKMI